MKRFFILIILSTIALAANSQNTEHSDSLKREFLLKLMDERGDTNRVLINNLPDIEYNYFIKRKSLDGGYYLELKPATPKDSVIKAKHGKLIEDKDLFYAYSYPRKIEILQELLSFQGDTTMSSKSYKIKLPDLRRIDVEPFTIQIEALYTFSRMFLKMYPDFLPKLTDKKGKKNYNGNQAKVNEVYSIYIDWLEDAIQKDFNNLTLPMTGTKYQWEGQDKITDKWFINFHYKNENN